MNIRQALTFATKKLFSKSTSAALDAEVLLMYVLSCDRTFLLTHPEFELDPGQKKNYTGLVTKAYKRIPVAYLTGSREFAGQTFMVNKHVLIPRPDTELLVNEVVKIAEKKHGLKLLDIGTGSGAIIVSLYSRLENKRHEFYASDVSEKALEVARINASNLNARVNFKKGSLLKPWDREKFDIITANLPYLAEKTILTKYEPKLALVAKNRGLHLIKNLLMQIKNLSSKPQYIFLEIGHNQRLDTKKLAAQYLPGYSFRCLQDLGGFDRLVILTKK